MNSLRELYRVGDGPSSSHTMGPARASTMYAEKHPDIKDFRVTLYGSLATTGKGHLTDKSIERRFGEAGRNVEVVFNMKEKPTFHPNRMVLEALKDGKAIDSWEVYSIGGGELQEAGQKREGNNCYPHNTMTEIEDWCADTGKNIRDYVYEFEDENIKDYLKEVYDAMMASIDRGLSTTGMLPGDLKVPRKARLMYTRALRDTSENQPADLLFAYAIAVSEENASGGVVCTAPTCGSSGVIPSVIRFCKEKYNLTEDECLDALAVGSLFGNVAKQLASLAGAEVGCQGEVGVATCMGAAIITYVRGGNFDQIEYAAELAMEHCLGMTCDPVAGYVIIPCIERNAVGAGRCLMASNYIMLHGGGNRISYDDVMRTMKETGTDINEMYRETAMGGLAKYYEKLKGIDTRREAKRTSGYS